MKKQRDQKGRFAPGWSGGPGRPPLAKEREYLDAFRSAIPVDQWIKATEAILTKARHGDVRCWKALAQYVMPQARTMIELFEHGDQCFRFAGLDDEQALGELVAEIQRSIDAMDGESSNGVRM